MKQQSKAWPILALALVTPLLVLDGWLFNIAQAVEVEIELTIRQSQYFKTKWTPPPEGASVVLTIKNEDDIRHGFTSQLFHNLLVRTLSDGVQIYGKGIEGLYLDPGATIQLRFQVLRPGDYEFNCDLHPTMRGELLLLHVDVV
ncbi:MAG: cupredoxin domain-containing protein [Nitrospirota bacterium]|nr:cupredoxin domain-containing protein [Nitrospirota bacterium]